MQRRRLVWLVAALALLAVQVCVVKAQFEDLDEESLNQMMMGQGVEGDYDDEDADADYDEEDDDSANGEIQIGRDVVVLTRSNFDQVLSENKHVLVEFYAPWCGHCQSLAPEFSKAASHVKGTAVLGAVDVTQEEELGKRFEIQGFPTLKFFQNGQYTEEYSGGRTASDLVAFIDSKTAPPVTQVTTADELKQLIEARSLLVVAHFTPENGDARKAFFEAADKLHAMPDVPVKVVNIEDRDLAKQFDMYPSPKMVLHRKIDNKQLEFDFFTEQGFDADALAKFVSDNVLPVVAPFEDETIEVYMGKEVPLFFLFIEPESESNSVQDTQEVKTLYRVAESFQNKMYFLFSEADSEAGELLRDSFKYPSDARMFAVVMDLVKNVRYLYPHPQLNEQELTAYLQDLTSGLVAPFVLSEPEPADNSGPVKVVVATSFDRLVVNSTSDVLIEFYSPDCQHCKQLEPVYKQVGDFLADYPGITVAKMDATANDIDLSFEIEGFPTVMFIPRDSKQRIKYDGDRSYMSLLRFVQRHAATELDLPPDVNSMRAVTDQLKVFSQDVAKLIKENEKQAQKIAELEASLKQCQKDASFVTAEIHADEAPTADPAIHDEL